MVGAAKWVNVRMYLTRVHSGCPAAVVCSEMYDQHKRLHIFYKCIIKNLYRYNAVYPPILF